MDESRWPHLSLTREDRVLTVSFRGENKVNSLSHALMRELTELAGELQCDAELNAIILTGQPDMFSAGMDLKDPELESAGELSARACAPPGKRCSR